MAIWPSDSKTRIKVPGSDSTVPVVASNGITIKRDEKIESIVLQSIRLGAQIAAGGGQLRIPPGIAPCRILLTVVVLKLLVLAVAGLWYQKILGVNLMLSLLRSLKRDPLGNSLAKCITIR